ncbi:MAG: ABC transporter permease, partial [Proteobacteria bacterium]|nr:ABC transporter permease [Pseudomonadota bacterium]
MMMLAPAQNLSQRQRRRALALVAPALLMIGVFMLVPMGIAMVYSFLTPDSFGGVAPPVTVESYIRFFFDRDLDDTLRFDPTYLQIFWRSIFQAVLTTLACIVIAVPFAWYMATRGETTRKILVLLVSIPFWTNMLVRTYCWVLLLRDEGLINMGLQAVGITQQPITFLYSDAAILIGLIYASLPFMILPVYGTLEKVDFRVVEAAFD